jgi:hypothetical protein
MRKWFVTAAVVAFSFVSVRADVTIVQTMTMEGAAAAAMGGQLPRITMRVKGQKSRADIDVNGQVVSSIADIAARQVIVLTAATKTATVSTPASAAPARPGAPSQTDISLKPTGKTQTIDGQLCEEHTMLMTIAMAEMMGQAPPEAAAMLKDVRIVINGSIWISKTAPGASEFAAFNKAAVKTNLMSAVTGMIPGQSGGLDKLMEAAVSAPGIPYLSEMTLVVDGTGPMVDAMKQMGPTKMIQKVASVSTEPIAEDTFKIPEGYTVEKK